MAEPPKVTGLSPNSATPGTRITIRGQNLGLNAKDVIGLTICKFDCLAWAEWKSSSKIVCRTGAGEGRGEVIVTTRSGGVGTCTVTFRGYIENIGPLQESAVWIDEPDVTDGTDKAQMVKRRDPLGFDHVLDLPSTEDELEEIYPEGSGEITADNFVPAWYLLEYHRNTSFEDIKMGLKHLSTQVAKRKRGPIEFVKRNINTFLRCYDTLNDVNQMLLRSESKCEGGTMTDKMERLVKEASKTADELFADVLQRKEKADATRNALSVLQRYRFLFSLPRTLERNIRNEEYDAVINGYESAKSLFAGTDVQAFKRVMVEVESLVEKGREKLKLKLQENPAKFDDRKRLIRFLVQLNAEEDPAWSCLTGQYHWIMRRMEKCKNDYQTGPDGLPLVTTTATDGEIQTHAYPRKFSVTSSGGSGSESHSPQRMLSFQGAGSSNIWSRFESTAPKAVRFVEELCDLILAQENVPDLWQLAQAYFSGQLVQWQREQDDESAVRSKREEEFQNMLASMLDLFSDLLGLTFFPDEYGSMNEARKAQIGSWAPFETIKQGVGDAWLPFCLRLVRSSYSSLSQLQLSLGTLQNVEGVAFKLRLHCVGRMFDKAKRDIQSLKAREDWKTETDECGCVTSLPVLFENICVESLLSVREIVTEAKPGESYHASYLEPLRTATADLLSECFQVFADVLDTLALYQEVGSSTKKGSLGSTSYYVFRSMESLNDLDEDDYMPTREKQLLIVMSNGIYTHSRVIPKIIDYYRSHGYPDWKNVRQTAHEILERVDSKLYEVYIECKELPIVGALEPGFVAGDWDWEECHAPKDVRGYLKEILLKMVKVHAEVYSVAPSLLARIFGRLFSGVVDEVCRLFECIGGFSENGIAQAQLELTVLENFLTKYVSAEAKDKLDVMFNSVSHLDPQMQTVVDALVRNFRERTKFQFAALLPSTQDLLL